MALLNDTQRELLGRITEAKEALENEVQRLNDLLREVARRDADGETLNLGTETGENLLARAAAVYGVRRADIIAAAKALPEL